MTSINPYINFNGNAEEAFTFYKSVFGGEFKTLKRFKDIASTEYPIPESEGNKIMRIELPIGNNILIANDIPSFMGKVNENENRSKIAITCDTKDEAGRIYTGLTQGATIEVELSDSPLGYFAMFRDKYGIEWTIDSNSN
jgi:PhnB protein